MEMEYNLNVIKEVRVTDSFQSMGKDIKGCQEESYDECTTRKYMSTLIRNCQCLPFKLRLTDEVGKMYRWIFHLIARYKESASQRLKTISYFEYLLPPIYVNARSILIIYV